MSHWGNDQKGKDEQPLPANRPGMWLSDLSIKQPVFITMVVLAVMVIGLISYTRMGLDLFPNMSFPIAVVQTAYPGANPEDVERSVTKPIEDAIISISGVDTVSSTSMDSMSIVIVQFSMDKDDKQAADDVRTRVNMIRNSLPSDVQEPVILRFDPAAMPILSFAIADKSGQRTAEQLRTIADDVLKPRLEQIAGVAAVNVTGGVVRQIHVDLSSSRLEAQGIAPQQVTQAIRAENLDMPAGRIKEGGREELLRTEGQVTSLTQLGNIPVVTKPDGVTIRVKDVASVSEGPGEARALSRLDGLESVVGQIQKQSGTNTVQVADKVKRELTTLQQEYPDVGFAVAYDQSTFTRQAVEDVQLSLVLGALLAALVVLFFFRDLRNTFVTVAGLPVVVLGTFAVLHAMGITLNMISLMALSLSVGMLIDDAIVVRENIFRHMEKGEAPKEAASRGSAEIALAVLAVTSTIVAVFLPIAFVEGIAGKFLHDFGITIVVAVIISLVEAFTLAPMLSAYFFKPLAPVGGLAELGSTARAFEALNQRYRSVLGWSLRHRLAVVIAGLAVFAASIAIIPMMVFSFIPQTDQGEFAVNLELPPGTLLADTDRMARSMERILGSAPEVEHVFTTVGSSTGAVESATVNARLRPGTRTDDIISRLRPELEEAADGAKLGVDRESSSSTIGGAASIMAGTPVQFAVQGNDFKALDEVSAQLVSRLQQIPGLIDASRSLKEAKPGRTIVLDRARAADLGVTTAQVATTMRSLINGDRAATYRAGDKDVDVVVRLDESDRSSQSGILRLPLITPRGNQISLGSVASIVPSTEPSQINRENRQRQVLVGANYLGRSLGEVSADAKAAVGAMDLPAGVSIKVTGQTKYMDEMSSSFGMAFVLAILFVYMILGSQFGSFIHPFTIMLALPFSVIGALLSLFVLRFDFDMLGMIGIILLMGLVTKNSILLVEFINQLRRRGLDVRAAILDAGPVRLRPILMTTMAMIFGMAPVAAGIGAGSEMRQPMAVSVIGGLITSTLLTLIIVPVAYSLIDDLGAFVKRRMALAGRADQSKRSAKPVATIIGILLSLLAAGGLVGFYISRETSTVSQSSSTQPTVISGLAVTEEPTSVPQLADLVQAMPTFTPSPSHSATPSEAGSLVRAPVLAPPPAPSPSPPSAPIASPESRIRVANTGGEGVYVRESPTTAAKRLIALPEGTVLERIGEPTLSDGRNWVKIRDPKGTIGWVPQEYVAIALSGR